MPSSIQYRSRKQEEKYAKRWEGRRQPASGSRPCQKGDVITEKYLVELKLTDKKSYRLETETLRKIWDEAAKRKKYPVLAIDFMQYGRTQISCVVLPTWVFEVMRGNWVEISIPEE